MTPRVSSVVVRKRACGRSWGQAHGRCDGRGLRAERDGSAIAPPRHEVPAEPAERIAGLAGRDHEQRAVEVREVINAAIRRPVHGREIASARPAAIDGGVVARAGNAGGRQRAEHRDGAQHGMGEHRLMRGAPAPGGGVGAEPGGKFGPPRSSAPRPATALQSPPHQWARRPGDTHEGDEIGQRARRRPAGCRACCSTRA